MKRNAGKHSRRDLLPDLLDQMKHLLLGFALHILIDALFGWLNGERVAKRYRSRVKGREEGMQQHHPAIEVTGQPEGEGTRSE